MFETTITIKVISELELPGSVKLPDLAYMTSTFAWLAESMKVGKPRKLTKDEERDHAPFLIQYNDSETSGVDTAK